MGENKRKILSTLVVVALVLTMFVNISGNIVNFKPFVMTTRADSNCANNNTGWHNSTTLNVTIEAPWPRISWYDFQICTSYTGSDLPPSNGTGETWISRRNAMCEVDNETWYRFVINVSSDQGWDNIEWVNVSGWQDQGFDVDVDGSLEGTGGYNRTNNQGANRNFFMYYDNRTDTNGFFNITYPASGYEFTIGNYTEDDVTDPLGITATETMNMTFMFKPSFQFRYASGPGEGQSWVNDTVNCTSGFPSGDGYDSTRNCWSSFDNLWSWNFNITVKNKGERWGDTPYISWARDEFGVYSYTEIISAGWPVIEGAPGSVYSTNSSSHFNQVAYGGDGNSHNITVRTRSNGNYTLTVNISDLTHAANPSFTLDNKTIYVRGGNLTSQFNYSDGGQAVVYLYGSGSGDGNLSGITGWQSHEHNGTSKYAGETADDTGLAATYPNFYNATTYDSDNSASHWIEYTCNIPLGQQTGIYRGTLYYRLRTQTH